MSQRTASADGAATGLATPSVPEPPAGDAATRRAAVRVDRALTELRRGRPVRLVDDDGGVLLVAAVETLIPATWSTLRSVAASESIVNAVGGISLALSPERAYAAGWTRTPPRPTAGAVVNGNGAGSFCARAGDVPFIVHLPPEFDLARLPALAGLDPAAGEATLAERGAAQGVLPGAAAAVVAAAIELTRLSRLVPAVLVARPAGHVAAAARPVDDELLAVEVADLLSFPANRAATLLRVSEAAVPLADHEDCRFVLFRETAADFEHVAIVVGRPDPRQPVTIRMHSSCLTGDLFGSLRCDCGDQLRGAIERLGEGGGVLLYLAQEGRGIGLANKLRAYARQDEGFDTIDADRYLGFRGDERNFGVAVQMLHALGITRVRLLTNNPAKIDALRAAGLDVVERLPIPAPVNRHNERYLTTKRDRAGHLIDVLAAARQVL
ncbi:MAG: GTP cyclohydrolase II [Lautropia sp.]